MQRRYDPEENKDRDRIQSEERPRKHQFISYISTTIDQNKTNPEFLAQVEAKIINAIRADSPRCVLKLDLDESRLFFSNYEKFQWPTSSQRDVDFTFYASNSSDFDSSLIKALLTFLKVFQKITSLTLQANIQNNILLSEYQDTLPMLELQNLDELKNLHIIFGRPNEHPLVEDIYRHLISLLHFGKADTKCEVTIQDTPAFPFIMDAISISIIDFWGGLSECTIDFAYENATILKQVNLGRMAGITPAVERIMREAEARRDFRVRLLVSREEISNPSAFIATQTGAWYKSIANSKLLGSYDAARNIVDFRELVDQNSVTQLLKHANLWDYLFREVLKRKPISNHLTINSPNYNEKTMTALKLVSFESRLLLEHIVSLSVCFGQNMIQDFSLRNLYDGLGEAFPSLVNVELILRDLSKQSYGRLFPAQKDYYAEHSMSAPVAQFETFTFTLDGSRLTAKKSDLNLFMKQTLTNVIPHDRSIYINFIDFSDKDELPSSYLNEYNFKSFGVSFDDAPCAQFMKDLSAGLDKKELETFSLAVLPTKRNPDIELEDFFVNQRAVMCKRFILNIASLALMPAVKTYLQRSTPDYFELIYSPRHLDDFTTTVREAVDIKNLIKTVKLTDVNLSEFADLKERVRIVAQALERIDSLLLGVNPILYQACCDDPNLVKELSEDSQVWVSTTNTNSLFVTLYPQYD